MPIPKHTLIQFSDVHIVPDDELLHGSVDSLANIKQALDIVEQSAINPAALLFTGDLADGGQLAAYQRLRAVVQPVAARTCAPVLYVMGNHDERHAFRTGLLGMAPCDEPYDYVSWVGGLRIIVLDSTEPGLPHGELSADQLAWLGDELATAAPDGTVLVMHHPPLPSPVRLVDAITLVDPDRLAAVVAGRDVRIIVAGHAHHPSSGLLGGVPVWVSGATAYSSDVLAPGGVHRGIVGAQCSRIDVYSDTTVATAVPLGVPIPLYELSEAELDAFVLQAERRAAQVHR